MATTLPASLSGLRHDCLGVACAGNPALKMQHWIKSLPHDNLANEWEHMIRDKSNVAAQHSAQLAQQQQRQRQEQADDAQSDTQAAKKVSPAGRLAGVLDSAVLGVCGDAQLTQQAAARAGC